MTKMTSIISVRLLKLLQLSNFTMPWRHKDTNYAFDIITSEELSMISSRGPSNENDVLLC